jgi:hypothetical protein
MEKSAMNQFPRLGRDLALLAWAEALSGCSCAPAESPTGNSWQEARKRLVERQLTARGIKDRRVLASMGKVPRQEFVPKGHRAAAYSDQPLPIGQGQYLFWRDGVAEILNLQPRNGMVKPYQVKQVRDILTRYDLTHAAYTLVGKINIEEDPVGPLSNPESDQSSLE